MNNRRTKQIVSLIILVSVFLTSCSVQKAIIDSTNNERNEKGTNYQNRYYKILTDFLEQYPNFNNNENYHFEISDISVPFGNVSMNVYEKRFIGDEEINVTFKKGNDNISGRLLFYLFPIVHDTTKQVIQTPNPTSYKEVDLAIKCIVIYNGGTITMYLNELSLTN